MGNNVRHEQRSIELYNPNTATIPLLQYDTTKLTLSLYAHKAPFTPADVLLNAIRSDETLVIQTTNIAINGNVITILLDPRIVDIPGTVKFELKFTDNSDIISSYKFTAIVKPTLVNGEDESPPASEIGQIFYLPTRAPQIDPVTSNWLLYNNKTGLMEVSEYTSRGIPIEIRAGLTHIQWKYVDGSTWTNIIALSELKGASGTDGVDGIDGKSVELRLYNNYIQWRQENGIWCDLISADNLIPYDSGANLAEVSNAYVIESDVGKVHTVKDVSPTYQKFREFTIYGETTQDTSSGVQTPDNPIDIVSVTNPELFVYYSKNVFDYQAAYDIAYSLYPSRVSMTTKDGRRCIYFSQTVSAPNNPFPIRFKPNTQYTISFDFYHDTNDTSGGGEGFRVLYTDGSSTYVIPSSVYNTWSTRTATTQAGRTVSEISWSFNQTMRTYLDVDTIQVEEGTVATTFEPYDGKLITLTDITLNRIGDLTDTIEVKDDKVMLRQFCHRCELKGTEEGYQYYEATSITGDLTYYHGFTFHTLETGNVPMARGTKQEGFCSHASTGTTNNVAVWFGQGNYHIYVINIRPWTGNDIASIKAYIAEQYAKGTPMTFVYKLLSPTETDISNTEVGQALLALPGTTLNTNIICDADCNIIYNANINKVINNLQSQIDTLVNSII